MDLQMAVASRRARGGGGGGGGGQFTPKKYSKDNFMSSLSGVL